jgi:hypothetical protein
MQGLSAWGNETLVKDDVTCCLNSHWLRERRWLLMYLKELSSLGFSDIQLFWLAGWWYGLETEGSSAAHHLPVVSATSTAHFFPTSYLLDADSSSRANKPSNGRLKYNILRYLLLNRLIGYTLQSFQGVISHGLPWQLFLSSKVGVFNSELSRLQKRTPNSNLEHSCEAKIEWLKQPVQRTINLVRSQYYARRTVGRWNC